MDEREGMSDLGSSSAGTPRFPADVYMQRFSVPVEYPVVFTRDVFAAENPVLADVLDRRREGRRQRAAVYVDAGAAESHPDLLRRIREYFHDRPETLELAAGPEVVAGGEGVKNSWEPVRDLIWAAGNCHLDRQSAIIAVGGGVNRRGAPSGCR